MNEKMFLNINNYKNFIKIFIVFDNPFKFIFSLIFRKVPGQITLKTPIGKISVSLRNYESLKTIFSIFCRNDYFVNNEKIFHFMDIGSNCGYSALYFLTRNNLNTVDCYEPDKENIEYLEMNLKSFSERVKIKNVGIGVKLGSAEFYAAKDGKYSSLLPQHNTIESYKIELVSFNDEIEKLSLKKKNILIKIDVEGMEEELIKSIDFVNKKFVKQIIVESVNCSKLIQKKHNRKLINGYIEHIQFY